MKYSIFFTLIGALLLPIRHARSLDAALYWMKIPAHTKFERTAIANEGLSIEYIADDYVIAIGSELDLNRLQDKTIVSFALSEQKDFPQQDAAYHTYEELSQQIRHWESAYPDLVRVVSIGKSVEGRDIWCVQIARTQEPLGQKPALILMGGHHAREHLSVDTPLRILDGLLQRYRQGEQRIQDLFDHREIHFLPAVNPDGLEYDVASGSYRYWRKNRAPNKDGSFGVDLNRNYGYEWGTGGSSSWGSADTYKGPTSFSEPETRAVRDYVVAHQNISTLLSFHTFSKLILYPWGHTYNPLSDATDRAVHEAMAKTMAKWNGYTPQQSSALYIASGDTTDWSYGTEKIISFTFELDPSGRNGANGFYPGADVIPDVVQKNTEPVLYLLEFADNPYRVLERQWWQK